MSDDVTLRLRATDENLVTTLREADKAAQDLAGSLEDASKSGGGAGDQFGSLAGWIEELGGALGEAKVESEELSEGLDAITKAGAGLAVAGAGGLVLSKSLIAIAEEGAGAEARLEAVLKQQGRLNDLAAINASIDDVATRGHFDDDDGLRQAVVLMGNWEVKTQNMAPLLEAAGRQAQTTGQAVEELANSFGKAVATGNHEGLKRSAVAFSESELAALEAAKAVGGLTYEMTLTNAIVAAVGRTTGALGESLTEAEKAANDLARTADDLMTNIGKGSSKAQMEVNQLTLRVLGLADGTEEAQQKAGYLLTWGSYAATATGGLIAMGSEIFRGAVMWKTMIATQTTARATADMNAASQLRQAGATGTAGGASLAASTSTGTLSISQVTSTGTANTHTLAQGRQALAIRATGTAAATTAGQMGLLSKAQGLLAAAGPVIIPIALAIGAAKVNEYAINEFVNNPMDAAAEGYGFEGSKDLAAANTKAGALAQADDIDRRIQSIIKGSQDRRPGVVKGSFLNIAGGPLATAASIYGQFKNQQLDAEDQAQINQLQKEAAKLRARASTLPSTAPSTATTPGLTLPSAPGGRGLSQDEYTAQIRALDDQIEVEKDEVKKKELQRKKKELQRAKEDAAKAEREEAKAEKEAKSLRAGDREADESLFRATTEGDSDIRIKRMQSAQTAFERREKASLEQRIKELESSREGLRKGDKEAVNEQIEKLKKASEARINNEKAAVEARIARETAATDLALSRKANAINSDMTPAEKRKAAGNVKAAEAKYARELQKIDIEYRGKLETVPDVSSIKPGKLFDKFRRPGANVSRETNQASSTAPISVGGPLPPMRVAVPPPVVAITNEGYVLTWEPVTLPLPQTGKSASQARKGF